MKQRRLGRKRQTMSAHYLDNVIEIVNLQQRLTAHLCTIKAGAASEAACGELASALIRDVAASLRAPITSDDAVVCPLPAGLPFVVLVAHIRIELRRQYGETARHFSHAIAGTPPSPPPAAARAPPSPTVAQSPSSSTDSEETPQCDSHADEAKRVVPRKRAGGGGPKRAITKAKK
jgi:hypothetical protein